MAVTEVTKNHQGGHKQKDLDYSDQRMYGPGAEIFSFYVSKLHPANERFFQTPLRSYLSSGHWFRNEPMGKNTLSKIMQRISGKADLSCVYTCHSVRASTITTLYQAGVSPQSIIAITKHKSTNSLNHYISDLSTKQKRDCAGILTSALHVSRSSDKSVVAPEAEDNSTLFDSPGSDGQRPNFDLSFCMQPLDDQLENGGDGSRAAEGMQPVIDAIYIDHNGTVAIPKPNSAGSVIDLPISVPVNPLADVTHTNRINPGDPGQNVTQNIMTHASFHGCTINFQMKQA